VLIEQLSSEEPETRRAAVIALGRIADRRAVPALVALLDVDRQDNRDLWIAAAGALARIGDGRAFEPLLALIGDRDAGVRQAAIGALNSIGHPAMALRIHRLLDDRNPHVRESAVRVAGYFGYHACVDTVIERCRDEDEAVRAAALEHLPFLGDPRAIDALRQALAADTPRARAAAAHALGGLDAADAAPLLAHAVEDPDAWVRYFAAISIGRRDDRTLVPLLERLAHSDPGRHVRVAAVEALGAIGGEGAVKILSPFAAADESDLANAAVRALGRVRSTAVLAPLAQAIRATDPRRRAIAAEALAATDHPDAVELLKWTASADTDPDVMRTAMTSLAALAGNGTPLAKRAVEALAAVTADAGRHDDAVRALSRVPTDALPWLAEQLAKDDADVRRGVVDALGRMAHPVASAYLQRAMDDSDAAVRRRAVAALSRLGTRGVARRLAVMARTDPSPVVREAATAALARQGGRDDSGSLGSDLAQ